MFAVLVSPTGSCFSSESAPRPFQYGIRRRGGTIFGAALPSYRQWVQADIRTHLIHRPARDILPPLGGSRVSCFSNRPFEVKRFQAIHHCSVDVARGLVLLFGIGIKALPAWDSRTRWNNLIGGLAVSRTAGPSRHTNSPDPSSREGHPSTARWISGFLLSHAYVPFMLLRFPWSSGTRCHQPRCDA